MVAVVAGAGLDVLVNRLVAKVDEVGVVEEVSCGGGGTVPLRTGVVSALECEPVFADGC